MDYKYLKLYCATRTKKAYKQKGTYAVLIKQTVTIRYSIHKNHPFLNSYYCNSHFSYSIN